MIYWFFGIPGSGKTHLANVFSCMAGIPQYEGDQFHTEDDRRAVAAGTFTLVHRHAQLERIYAALSASKSADAVVTHPLPDKESRARVRGSGGEEVRLVYVRAPLSLIKERLRARTDHHFGPDLLDAWLDRHWQEPEGENHFLLENGSDPSLTVQQLQQLCVKSAT